MYRNFPNCFLDTFTRENVFKKKKTKETLNVEQLLEKGGETQETWVFGLEL